MKRHMPDKLVRLVFAVLLGLASTSYAGAPPMEVTVFDAGRRVAFRGATNANATFATRTLRAGPYIVQFNAKTTDVKGNQYLLVVSAGKKKVIAAAVPGAKLTGGGAAMKVDVGPGLNITGQVAEDLAFARENGSKYRVIDGKRYVWIANQIGSNLGGHWAEEGLAPSANVIRLSSDNIREMQARAGEGSMIPRGHHHPEPPGG